MKKSFNKVVWLSVPLLLVVGCAERERAPSVSYSPALSESFTPTSGRTDARVYAGSDQFAPPPGAAQQDWTVAEEVRSLLKSEPKLGNAGMAAVVKDGVVTLRGGVRNDKDRERLREEIARLPGVQRVDDQMEFKNPLRSTPGETQNY